MGFASGLQGLPQTGPVRNLKNDGPLWPTHPDEFSDVCSDEVFAALVLKDNIRIYKIKKIISKQMQVISLIDYEPASTGVLSCQLYHLLGISTP